MARSWLALRDRQLGLVCGSFLETISAAPSEYGLAATEVALLRAHVETYVQKLALADAAGARSDNAVTEKDAARRTLIGTMRTIERKVRASDPAIEKLEALGMRRRTAPRAFRIGWAVQQAA